MRLSEMTELNITPNVNWRLFDKMSKKEKVEIERRSILKDINKLEIECERFGEEFKTSYDYKSSFKDIVINVVDSIRRGHFDLGCILSEKRTKIREEIVSRVADILRKLRKVP